MNANDITNLTLNIGGSTVTIGNNWNGNGVPTTGTASDWSRIGSTDNDDASDWVAQSNTIGSTNPGLNLPWAGCGAGSGQSGCAPIVIFELDSAGVGTHWITYTFIDSNGCVGIDSQQVTVLPVADVTAGPDTVICAGEPAQLTATATGTPGPHIFNWEPATGLNTTTGDTVIATPDTTTTYTVTVTDMTDTVGCTNMDTVRVEVNPLPEVTIVPIPNDSICYGDSLCLTVGGGACNETPLTLPPQTGSFNFGVRGHWFTAPVDFTITSLMAPTTVPGNTQAIQVIELPGPPPAFPVTTGGTTLFFDNTTPAGTPIPVNIQISAGDVIGIVGGNYGPGNLTTSYGPTGPYNTTIGGQPITLTRFGNQTSIQGGPQTGGFWQEPAFQVGRIHWDYCLGSGNPSGGSAAPGSTYLWSTGETTETICPNPLESSTYWVEVTDSNGCVNYDTIDIYVNPEIIADAGPDVDVCKGEYVQIGGSPTGMGGTDTLIYDWEPNMRITDTSAANPMVNPLYDMTYTVTVIDGRGCTHTDEVEVTVREIPLANAGDDEVICKGESTVIGGTPAVFGGTGPYTYSWEPAGNLNDASIANPTASPGATTAYTLTVTDFYGCEDDSIMKVYVRSLPSVEIAQAGPFCENDAAVVLDADSTGGTWSGPGIVDASLGLFDPSVAGVGTHQIVFENTNAYGCTNSDTAMITVTGLPEPEITSAEAYCLSEGEVTLTATPAGGTWSGNGITDASAGTFNTLIAGLGSHPIVYGYTDTSGCVGYDTMMISISEAPEVSIEPVETFCQSDDAVLLSGSPSGGTWSGPGIVDASTGEFDPSAAGVGTHVITYTYTDAVGCSVEAELTIIVEGIPNLDIDAAGPFCQEGTNTVLTASVGGGYWSGPGIVNPLIGEFNPTAAGPGMHTVTYTVTGSNGCVTLAEEQIMVNASPNAQIEPAGPYCADAPSVTLTAATSGGTWSGQGITNGLTGEFDPAEAGAGTHIITYAVTDSNGCQNTGTTTIKVNELPVISGSVTNVSCSGGSDGQVDVHLEGGAPPYQFNWSNGAVTEDIDEVTDGTYSFTVTDAKGCSNTGTFEVNTESSQIMADATVTDATTPVYENGSIDVTISGGVAPYSYTWSNGAKTEDITGLRPDIYTLVVTDALGCSETFEYEVEAAFGLGIDEDELSNNVGLFPNPTQDVINITIELGGKSADMNMTVFDMLGRKVYERHEGIDKSYQHSIDVEEWASGQYMIRFDIEGTLVTKKFVISR
jgi:hypothetical protein